MKDLSDINMIDEAAHQVAEEYPTSTAQGAQPRSEDRPVSEPKKIKSFHRRARGADADVPAPGTIAVEPPEAAIAKADDAPDWVLETEHKLPSKPVPLWNRLRVASVDSDLVDRRGLPMVDRHRDTESAKAVDLLRTRMLHTLRAQGWRRVAVASPTSGCGATWMTSSLAQGLARVPNTRTIAMDLNFRKPGLASALAVPAAGDMAGFLSGRLAADRHLLRLSEGLAVGLNGAGRIVGAEVLHNPTAASVVDDLMEESRADVALFDLPPVLEHDDLSAFLPQVDGVLLVADGTRTTAKDLAACEKILAGHTQLLGVVLNRARCN